MDAGQLIETNLPPIPAPIWFVQFFKVLGFTLHAVPMNLWYAGILIALALYLRGGEHGQTFSRRLMTQMPVILAYGINLGIVPLLFVQVAYAQPFYSATILMAWHWLAIVILLIPAYYGVYLYSFGLRADGPGLTTFRRAAGWVAAVLLVGIGWLFVNGLSLMANPEAWPELWKRTDFYGATLGTGSNIADATLWPRWLLMLGLAIGTTAAWLVFDAAWFAQKESDQYRSWAVTFSWKLYTVGMVWFAVAGTLYVVTGWHSFKQMFGFPTVLLTLLTALAPGLPWLLLFRQVRAGEFPTRGTAALIGAAQLGVLGVNAVSRQVLQNIELKPYFDVLARETATQYGPLAMFLIAFLLGAGVMTWMIWQIVRPSQPAADS
jgi:hypothetical protein